MSSDEKIIRRSREVRVEVKTEERKTKRERPRLNSVLNDRTAVPEAIKRAYPDCVFFWENDENGAVQKREANGWEVVRGMYLADGTFKPGGVESLGNVVSQPVGPGVTTGNMSAVLMMLPREWYEDDIAAQEDQNRQVENALRRGSIHGQMNADGTYAPRLPNGAIGYSRRSGGHEAG